MNDLLLGIDIGGTKSAVIVGDRGGNVIAREQIATAGPQETLESLITMARTMRDAHELVACGISCGGPLSSRDGTILSPPNLPDWNRVPVVQIFTEAMDLPTALENDANASAVAEWQWGFRREVDDLIYLTCGTGQGAGLILGGRLHRGRQDLAGEVGHIRLGPGGPIGYGKAGSAEGLTSGSGLAKLAVMRLAEPHTPTSLDAIPPDQIDGKSVGDAALAGDTFAQAIVAELANYLGQLCAVLIDTLNPQRISLGSMAARLDGLLLDGVRAAAKRESLKPAYEACTIDKSVLGSRVQDLAALAVAMQAAA
ncbi:MAG: sugar kinase [Phycisphaerales bacterium]|nr:sugar kinase [Phycisphaerales bacterium]